MEKNLDSLGIGKALELFPEQVMECFKQGYGANLETISPKAVVVSGMGGSSNAAKIIQGVYESEVKIPFLVYNDYSLPAWVNSDTLVIANSYSGNTEETLSSVEAAKRVGAKVIGISTGGKIQDVVINPGATNPSGFPKSGLGISFGALAGVLARVGIINLTEDQLNKALDEIVEIRKDWKDEETAKWLNGFTPVLFSGRPLTGALNAGRNALCEISRNFSQFYDFPEVNHVLIEALQKPESALNNRFVFFDSKFLNERVKTRFEITKGILDEMGLKHTTISLQGSSILSQALELPHFCAWVGYHLSLLQNTDPGPEPWIIKLKNELSQPVH